MKDKQKKGLVALLVLCVVIALGVFAYQKMDKDSAGVAGGKNTSKTNGGDSSTMQSGGENAAPPSEENQSVESKAPNSATVKGKPLTYNQVAEIYIKSGFRFQISNCHGTPGKLNMKSGTKFMIDNRDKAAHTFVVDKQTYKVPGYGWAIATAPGYGNYYMTCDGGGAAEIQVYP